MYDILLNFGGKLDLALQIFFGLYLVTLCMLGQDTPPLKNHKNNRVFSNGGPDPLKSQSAFNIGPSSARQRNAS